MIVLILEAFCFSFTEKLRGMHETSGKLSSSDVAEPAAVKAAVLEVANVAQVSR